MATATGGAGAGAPPGGDVTGGLPGTSFWNVPPSEMTKLEESMQHLTRVLAAEYMDVKNERALLDAEEKRIADLINRTQNFDIPEHERLKLNVGGTRHEIRASCIRKNIYFKAL